MSVITLYHGSKYLWSEFSLSLCKESCTEGRGVYLCDTVNATVQAYGQYVYVFTVSNDKILDFTQYGICLNVIKKIARATKFKFHPSDLMLLAKMIQQSDHTIIGIASELAMILDSKSEWHESNLCDYDIEEKFNIELQKFFDKYVLKYNDNDFIGYPIYCAKNPQLLTLQGVYTIGERGELYNVKK